MVPKDFMSQRGMDDFLTENMDRKEIGDVDSNSGTWDGTLVQIYTPTRPKGWRYTKKIIYHDTIESVKGHKNSKDRDFLIAH